MRTFSMGLIQQKKNMTYQIAFEATNKECGVILIDKESGEEIRRISLEDAPRFGSVVVGVLDDIRMVDYGYLLYDGENIFADPYAKCFLKMGEYGKASKLPKIAIYEEASDKVSAKPLEGGLIKNPVVYEAHVRGFTMHPSSKVKGGGTFYGMTQKIPYLKRLGIDVIALQPIYEFEEMDKEGKLNYWGYTSGYYFAPKAAYSCADNAVKECKEMINAFHVNGMEVVLQFYFPKTVKYECMVDALRHWVYAYGVDGFHLIGEDIPFEALSKDAMLSKVRLWYHDGAPMTAEPLYGKETEKRFGLYREDYLYEMRRFLKGDENLAGLVSKRMRTVPDSYETLNFFAHYVGFTLADTVSYERKNNEENGEGGQDGPAYNASWNCGVEGTETKKRSVVSLRKKQLKIAFMLLMVSTGIPVIFMGDEFGNSQGGNNNPYCIDSETTWLDWSDVRRNKELTDFVTQLIAFRKSAKVFTPKKECMLMDYASCGYPDLSYHGKEAWKPQWESFSREFAMLYCGDYVGEKGTFYYIAINMHHEPHEFALPKLPKKVKISLLKTTDERVVLEDKTITVPERSVAIYFIDTRKQRVL